MRGAEGSGWQEMARPTCRFSITFLKKMCLDQSDCRCGPRAFAGFPERVLHSLLVCVLGFLVGGRDSNAFLLCILLCVCTAQGRLGNQTSLGHTLAPPPVSHMAKDRNSHGTGV